MRASGYSSRSSLYRGLFKNGGKSPEQGAECELCCILLQNNCVFLLSLAIPCGPISKAGPCRPTLAPSCCVASTARLASPHALRLPCRTSGIRPISTTPSVTSWPSVSIKSPPGMQTAMMPRVSGTTPCLSSALSGRPWSQSRTWRVLPPLRVWNTAEFISFYGIWYDAPLASRSSDRRHHPWPVYGLPMCSLARRSFWISPARPSTSFTSSFHP